MHADQEDQETFEQTFPRYPFAELVRLGIVFAKWLAKALKVHGEHRRGVATRRRADKQWLRSR